MSDPGAAEGAPVAPARQVAVCGPGICTPEEERLAADVGRLLAGRGVTVVCGGGGGVMAAAARGARLAGGVAIGVRPDVDRSSAPSDLTAVISTGLGEARNAVVVNSADAVVVVGGSWGTLSELALALRRGIPVVCLGGWRVVDVGGADVPGPVHAGTAEEAVAAATGG